VTEPLPPLDYVACLALVRQGNVRLTRGSGRWAVFAQSGGRQSLVGHVSPATAEALRSEGLLDGEGRPVANAPSTDSFSRQRPPRLSGNDTVPLFNTAESPLAWLRARRDREGRPLIGDEQFRAGERLRADFERSMLARRITTRWEEAGTGGASRGGGFDISDAALAARQRYHAALTAVGPELAGILQLVCCLAAGMEEAERQLDLPRRSGRAVLGLALAALARHYGFDDAGERRARSRHWGQAGYRAAIPEAAES
jgi:hypothetical protein